MKFLPAKSQFVCFAPIDLKLARLHLRDGYNQGTNVPLTSAIEPIGETDIALTGMNSAVPNPATTVGVSVKFGSDATEYTVTARTLGAGTNEVQTIEIDNDVSGGNFTLTYGGQVTGSILYNASAAVIKAALEALSTLGLGTVVVTGSSPKWTVTFTGTMASTDASMLVGTNVDMTGGVLTDVAVAETVAGVDGVNEIQTLTANVALTVGTYTLTFDGETTAAIPYDADAAAIELQLETLDSIPQGEATVATGAGSWPELNATLTVTFSGSLGKSPLDVIVEDETGLTGEIAITRSTPGVAEVTEVQTISINDTVSGGTFTLTHDTNTSAPILYNATAAEVEAALGAAPVSQSVTVTGGPGPATDWIVTWDAAGTQLPISGTGTNLTGGSITAVSITEVTQGQSGTETTQITVSPSLVVATTAGGSITFGGRKLEIKVGEGNLTYSENQPREYLRNRGKLDTVRNADEEPVDVSFDFVWTFLTAVTSSGVPTIEDVLKQRGEASTWVSTSSDLCEPYCVDVEVHYDPACGGANTESIVLEEFRYETLDHNLSDAQVSCTGKCNKTEATLTRGS